MIETKKSALFKPAFSLVLVPMFKRSFHRLLGQGVTEPVEKPVLFIANHSSWWDGLLFFLLNENVWRHDIHIMMDEAGLRRFPFFRWLGAFSVDRKKPKDVLASLRYAEQLLNSGKSVILFPQGAEQHLEKRPLEFQSGIVYLMEKCPDIPVVPISLFYSFGHERKPEIWVRQHDSLRLENLPGASRLEKTETLQQHCTAHLDALRTRVIEEDHEGFSKVAVRWRL